MLHLALALAFAAAEPAQIPAPVQSAAATQATDQWQAAQPLPPETEALIHDLLAASHRAAVRDAVRRPADVRNALELLKDRFDNSIHSARDKPVQRQVAYDAGALKEGLALGKIYRDATRDDRPLRMFAARQTRIDGTRLLNERKFEAAVARLNQALAEAQRLDDVWLQVITHVNLAYGHLQLGHMKETLSECMIAKKIAEQSTVKAQALATYNLASMQLHLNDFDDAIPYSLESMKLAKRAGVKLWEGNSLLNLGVAYFGLGRFDDARATLAQARNVLEQTQDKLGLTRCIYDQALAAGQAGDIKDAVAQMESALPIIKALDIRHSHEIELDEMAYYNYIEENSLRLLAEWHGKLGHAEEARQYASALETLVAKRPANMQMHQHKWVG